MPLNKPFIRDEFGGPSLLIDNTGITLLVFFNNISGYGIGEVQDGISLSCQLSSASRSSQCQVSL